MNKNMPDYTKLSVCIVGANGRMGRLFKGLWQDKLGKIYELDLRPGSMTLTEADITTNVPGADVVIMSVPIDKLESALRSIAPQLNPSCLLSDLSSVKTLPMQLMEQYHAGPVVGAHPLFGPESVPQCLEIEVPLREEQPDAAGSVAGADNRFLQQQFKGTIKQVALVPGRPGKSKDMQENLDLLAGLFKLAGCSSFTTSTAEHDRAIATIQALNFLSNLAYFATASDLPDLEKYITPSFRRRLFASRNMLQEDAELFINIARHTPLLREAIQSYSQALKKAANLDKDAMGDLLVLARRYFADN